MARKTLISIIKSSGFAMVGLLLLGGPLMGCLFVGEILISHIYQNSDYDTTPFTTAGFAFLATITALTFNFLKSFDKEKDLKRFYMVQKAGMIFFLSTFFFLFSAVTRFGVFNAPLLGLPKNDSMPNILKWIALLSVFTAFLCFLSGIQFLFPYLLDMFFSNKEWEDDIIAAQLKSQPTETIPPQNESEVEPEINTK